MKKETKEESKVRKTAPAKKRVVRKTVKKEAK